MKTNAVLVVDDEKNIRNLVKKALSRLQVHVDTAMNGEDALKASESGEYAVVLLDLRMPGMDGMEVLKRLRDSKNPANVIIVSAHGTIDNAVEAMKLGAVDFLQKPFSPDEIRTLVAKSLERHRGGRSEGDEESQDYASWVQRAKAAVERRDYAGAQAAAEKAVAFGPERPEAFNLLGIITEVLGQRVNAQKYYRAAVSLDPTYEPARNNLHRLTGLNPHGVPDAGGV